MCLISIAAACGSAYLQGFFDSIADGAGKVVSVSVSAGLLLAVGIANLWGAVHSATAGEEHSGVMARCCPLLLSAIDAEWKMLLLGFLFGLGFETSSEVALLALAAMGPSQGIPPAATLVLPLLFASGMSLIDTLDGMIMSWAYGAASGGAGGRQLYNLILTVASSLIAIGIGIVELLGCAQARLDLQGPFWDVVALANANFEYVGYFVIGFFAISMLGALAAFTCPARLACLPVCEPPATADAEAEADDAAYAYASPWPAAVVAPAPAATRAKAPAAAMAGGSAEYMLVEGP